MKNKTRKMQRRNRLNIKKKRRMTRNMRMRRVKKSGKNKKKVAEDRLLSNKTGYACDFSIVSLRRSNDAVFIYIV